MTFDLLSPSTWFGSASASAPPPATPTFSVDHLLRLYSLLTEEIADPSHKASSSSSFRSVPSGFPSSRSLFSLGSAGSGSVSLAPSHVRCIEALRAISEIVVWADQQTPEHADAATVKEGSAIVDVFLSRHMVQYFYQVLLNSADDDAVVAQVLQTMNILIQNLRCEQTVYCVFSNNHVNEILGMDSLFLMGQGGDSGEEAEALEVGCRGDGEVLGLYVNLLKTIVMRLDEHSVEFFLKEGRVCVPYTRALRVAGLGVAREDGMVRAAVRAVVLKLYSIVPESVFSVCCGGKNGKTAEFFARVREEMVGTAADIERLLRERGRDRDRDRDRDRTKSGSREKKGQHHHHQEDGRRREHRILALLGRLEDDLAFFSDVIGTRRVEVVEMMLREVWPWVVLGSLRALEEVQGEQNRVSRESGRLRAKMLTALLVLEAVCKAVRSPSLVGLLVSLLLTGDSAKAAQAVVDELGLVGTTVDELIGEVSQGEAVGVVTLADRKGIRASVLSCLSPDRGLHSADAFDASCRLVVLRTLAAMMDGCTPGGVLCSVGLLSVDEAAGDTGACSDARGTSEHADEGKADHIASHPVGSGQLFETEFSVCFPERCAELQRAVFEAVIATETSVTTEALTYATWIFMTMLRRKTALVGAPVARLQEFLARAHDAVLLCLPGSGYGYATAKMLDHCWGAQQRYLERLNPQQAPSKLASPPTNAASAAEGTSERLERCLNAVAHFIAAEQLYGVVVSKGNHDVPSRSPFPAEAGDRKSKDTTGDPPPVLFRTSAGTLELGTTSIVVRDDDSGIVVFEAPTPTVALVDGADGEAGEAGRSPRQVTLISDQVEVVRGTMRAKLTVLRGVTFEARLDRAFVENSLRVAKKAALESSREFLEHCIAS